MSDRGGGERGLSEEGGTGVWNHARSGFVRRTSLSICSRISLSRKKVLHFDVTALFRGFTALILDQDKANNNQDGELRSRALESYMVIGIIWVRLGK